ncbi:DUF2690 domain-containing protein [Streptomyces sp. NPDC093085]|uniref:helix-turn-helix domain-containing protein n=1 Tax=Streptomyces sp. NPDC093085 TaxID=3155068 RepID=UPI00343C1FE1
MPRWKALPEGLDPEVSEFTSQLRRLVDRSGLSIAAVADRTGYSKTSWERYLGGRLLPPKGAVVALAQVTGVDQGHLTTMWELAERAWSRSEMRHDMTMEAIRISQARTALAESGKNPVVAVPDPAPTPAPNAPAGTAAHGAGNGSGATVDLGRGRGTVPPQGAPGAPGAPYSAAPNISGPPFPGGPGAQQAPYGPNTPYAPHAQAGPGGPGGQAGPGGQGGGKRGGRRKAMIFVSGLAAALIGVAAAFALTNLGGDGDGRTVAQSPTPKASTSEPVLPEGVKCAGDRCAGKDPEEMGCSGEYAETVASATVGTALVEVRYSKTCGAAWARITQAALGDEIRISPAKGPGQSSEVETATNAYTPMTTAEDATAVKACATLKTGETGCATPQG